MTARSNDLIRFSVNVVKEELHLQCPYNIYISKTIRKFSG